MDIQQLSDNYARVQERIAAARQRGGRDDEVSLVAVSKTQSVETVAQAYHAGLRLFGENRVEEAGPKAESLARLIAPDPPPAWHMIGHLQSRKAAQVLPWASMVHSIDSTRLATRLNRMIEETGEGQVLPILLEVNVSGEASKDGFTGTELPAAIGSISALPHLRIEGLMTMAPIVDDPELARPVFRALRRLRDELAATFPGVRFDHLSMGMTDDFEVAIEEGATIVRIGRAIFGER